MNRPKMTGRPEKLPKGTKLRYVVLHQKPSVTRDGVNHRGGGYYPVYQGYSFVRAFIVWYELSRRMGRSEQAHIRAFYWRRSAEA